MNDDFKTISWQLFQFPLAVHYHCAQLTVTINWTDTHLPLSPLPPNCPTRFAQTRAPMYNTEEHREAPIYHRHFMMRNMTSVGSVFCRFALSPLSPSILPPVVCLLTRPHGASSDWLFFRSDGAPHSPHCAMTRLNSDPPTTAFDDTATKAPSTIASLLPYRRCPHYRLLTGPFGVLLLLLLLFSVLSTPTSGHPSLLNRPQQHFYSPSPPIQAAHYSSGPHGK